MDGLPFIRKWLLFYMISYTSGCFKVRKRAPSAKAPELPIRPEEAGEQGPSHWTGGPKSAILNLPLGKEAAHGGAIGGGPLAAGHPLGGEPAEKLEQLFADRRAEPADRHGLPPAVLPRGHGAPAGGDARGPGPAGHFLHPPPQRPHRAGAGADPPRLPDLYRGDRQPRREKRLGSVLLEAALRGICAGRLHPGGDGGPVGRQSGPDGGPALAGRALYGAAGRRGAPLRRPYAAVRADAGPHAGAPVPV